jgi:hypothetical protein
VLDSHYANCSHCEGLGLLKTTEEVAADAVRHCGWLLQYEQVKKIELTCSPTVGTYLFSNKRNEFYSYEQKTSKRIVVRISEGIATDKVAFYAYDERGSDIELHSLQEIVPPTIKELLKAEKRDEGSESEVAKQGRKRSRRRSSRKAPLADAATISGKANLDKEMASLDKPVKRSKPKKKSKKTTPAETAIRVYQFAKSIGKTSKEIVELCKEQGEDVRGHMSTLTEELATKIKVHFDDEQEAPKRKRRRRGGRGKGKKKKNAEKNSDSVEVNEKGSTKNKKKKTRRSSKKKTKKKAKKNPTKKSVEAKQEVKKTKPRRTLYGGSRRQVSSEEVQQSMVERG